MKSFKTLVAMAGLAFLATTAFAQTDKATTRKIVEDKNYTFVATSATPLNGSDINNILSKMPGGGANGGNINLTGSNYDVRITKDSLVAYLPFYGRSYTAPLSNEESGFKFTSKNFIYDTTKRKRGGWDVRIYAKDVKDGPQLTFSISESGYATLSMVSNNRQAITYNGYLSENKSK
ncbi:DUF4251 domain-containing protein [Pedobacter sp. KR3-3]|uniref:DUF4251 domain-containing protein n=1 Tax=Pedobacter albus TaxID=3113905 RepID=A0ABU7I9C0_9SPHI|nr:DUF4251 domain-containing protein [Pedobacter sp. KR3-3]MEE1946079.1 DUF4251 domain-containing protein [Pedobacter sp. KR3-3]